MTQYVLYSSCRTVDGTQYMTLDACIFDNLRSELRRGSLILAVLAQLRSEQYGYTLRKALADHGMEIEESTLYPLLRRLETQGLLHSEWREEDKRNKRFYVLSTDGQEVLEQLLAEWRSLDSSLSEIVGGKEHATR
jgi:PadR family transcriptional regulator PadR